MSSPYSSSSAFPYLWSRIKFSMSRSLVSCFFYLQSFLLHVFSYNTNPPQCRSSHLSVSTHFHPTFIFHVIIAALSSSSPWEHFLLLQLSLNMFGDSCLGGEGTEQQEIGNMVKCRMTNLGLPKADYSKSSRTPDVSTLIHLWTKSSTNVCIKTSSSMSINTYIDTSMYQRAFPLTNMSVCCDAWSNWKQPYWQSKIKHVLFVRQLAVTKGCYQK